jgi:hypothetical protein
VVAEPRSNDPGKDGHREGCCRPHAKDPGEGVLPYGFIPINFFGLTDIPIYCRCGDARNRHGAHLRLLIECMARRYGADFTEHIVKRPDSRSIRLTSLAPT